MTFTIRITRPLAACLAIVLLLAFLIPLATRATQSNQRTIALAPGEKIAVTCDTSLSSVIKSAQASLECDTASPTATSSTALSVNGFSGVKEGQVISGTVGIEARVSGQQIAHVAFELNGPAAATHTEERAPYFFLGDRNGQPLGWDTTQYPDGTYTLKATATNSSGQSDSLTVRFRVANTSQPQATATPAASPAAGDTFSALRSGELEFGVAAHLFYTDRARPLAAARAAGFGWIRQQIHWRDIEGSPGSYAWGELDAIVESVDAAGLKLLISVVRAPDFYTTNGGDGMPEDPQSLGNFVAALAEHYKGRVHAIEIWNEQNLSYENGGRVSKQDAGHYVELLKEAYTRIKQVDPTITVLAGPLSSTGITSVNVAVNDMDYYEAMYTYQNGMIHDYMDAQAVHPGGAANPPDTMWPDNPSSASNWTDHPTFYFRHVEDVRKLMEQYGMGDKPIWITEFGWATRNNTPGYEFGNQVTYEQQAQYIVDAMRMTNENYPWVSNMFLWNLNFAPLKAQQGDAMHEQASFSILDSNYRPRPAYTAIQHYLKGLKTGS